MQRLHLEVGIQYLIIYLISLFKKPAGIGNTASGRVTRELQNQNQTTFFFKPFHLWVVNYNSCNSSNLKTLYKTMNF